ncbi:hypothetical protein ACWDZ6_06540 [Streptomyces sp. NPDC002926]
MTTSSGAAAVKARPPGPGSRACVMRPWASGAAAVKAVGRARGADVRDTAMGALTAYERPEGALTARRAPPASA